MARGGDLRPLRSAAERVVRRLGAKGVRDRAVTVEAWPEAVGREVAAHTRATGFKDGGLAVTVDSHAWATELAAMEETFIAAVNRVVGKSVVSRVRFTVGKLGGQGPEIGAPAREEPARIPVVALSGVEMRQIEAGAAAIVDEGLREAVVRAMKADLEWKKGVAAAEKNRS